MNRRLTQLVCSPLVVLAFACGGDDEEERGAVGDACAIGDEIEDEGACHEGLSCEPLAAGGGLVCGAPVSLRGTVVDSLSGDAIAGARVIALGREGAPAGNVAVTDADGNYSVQVSAPRNPDGSISSDARWTLNASAQGYQIFPAGPRPAVPIAGDQVSGEDLVIEAANTGVSLLPLPNAGELDRQIQGTIAGSNAGGTLVVAEGAATPAPYGIAADDGEFVIFNVPRGQFELAGYKRGQQLERASADTSGDSVTGMTLQSSDEALAAVSGSVNIVNAPGGSMTSVVLVPESVFDATLERGPVPFGLRAPGLPDAPSVSSAFSFEEVPRGDYVVLAAFENDQLVRDPDTSIGGTTTQRISVALGESVSMDASFKITEHLAIVAPGADSPELISGAPEFRWADDSSEDRYELEVYSALGDLVWSDRAVPSVSGSSTVERAYAGPSLTSGMVYQFRVTSFRDGRNGPTAISRSEDLRGVFEYR